MRQSPERRPVVVGTDGSLPSRRAVARAAEEAARRGLPLRIVHATSWTDTPGLTGADCGTVDWTLSDADLVLDEAAHLAEQALPASEISTVSGFGWPAAVLLDEAAKACMLVVGNRGLGGFSGLFLGSVSIEVAGVAPCPVLVVRHSRLAAPDAGPVVVGVDGTDRSGPALEAAFEAAALAGAPLLALHVRRVPVLAGRARTRLACLEADGPAPGATLLDDLLEPYRARYPDVPVSTEVREGHAGEVLADAGAAARLLVLAARGRGELGGLMLGSTTQAAIHHAECAVLVVPVAHE